MGFTETMNACFCISPAHPLEAAAHSDLVFAGKVIEVVQTDGEVFGFPRLIRVETIEVFIGEKEASVFEILNSGTSCDFSFQPDQNYLIYAHQGEEHYVTSICTRTRTLERAEFDLKVLRGDPEALEPVAMQMTMDGDDLTLSVTGGYGRNWSLESSHNLRDWEKVTQFNAVFKEKWTFTDEKQLNLTSQYFRVKETERLDLSD